MSDEKSDGAVVGDSPRAPSSGSQATTPETAPANASTAWERHDRGVRWWLLVLCVLCCTLLYSLDNSILADVAPV